MQQPIVCSGCAVRFTIERVSLLGLQHDALVAGWRHVVFLPSPENPTGATLYQCPACRQWAVEQEALEFSLPELP